MAKKNSYDEKLEEANFEVSSLDEVKDEKGNGIFHMRTKTKIISAISAVILLVATVLIYLTVEKYFAAQMWQVIVWGLCGILSLYAIFARSIAAVLFNVILFLGLSFLPFWQSGYETIQPVIEKFSELTKESPAPENTPVEKIETPVPEKNPVEKIETPVPEKNPVEKIEAPAPEKNPFGQVQPEERIIDPTLPQI